jgi:hypothetical protein
MSSTPSATASSGIDFKTLWITAASSAAAAYVTSKVWAPGTLAAAAFTPVLVAVIREGLAKSTEVVTRVVPVKGVVRSTDPDGSSHAPDVAAANAGGAAADLAAQQPPPQAEDPALRVAQTGEISYHGSRNRTRNWRVAIVTGLLGFLIAAVVFTVPELVAGGSAAGGGRGTTLFGGKTKSHAAPAVTTTTKTTQVKTVTTPPQQTVTVPPETVTTPPPTVTAPPQTTTPEQATTTPPPVAEPPPAELPVP